PAPVRRTFAASAVDVRRACARHRASLPMSVSDLSTLQAEFDEALSQAQSAADLKAVRDRFLGRKSGRLTALLKTLGSLPPDERRTVGAAVNALKQTFEARLA